MSAEDTFWAALVPELTVRDLQQSLRFYVEYLGFRERYARPETGFAYLELGRAQIMLEQDRTTAKWRTAPLKTPFGRGVNFQIEVEDVAPILRRLERATYTLFVPARRSWYRDGTKEHGQEEFLVQDPDGYLLRFFHSLGTRSTV